MRTVIGILPVCQKQVSIFFYAGIQVLAEAKSRAGKPYAAFAGKAGVCDTVMMAACGG